jgi:HPt (histidine-containing phosphotransfer) domain-containing protein
MAEHYTFDPAIPVIESEVLEGIVEVFGVEDPTAILDLIDTFLAESTKQCDDMQRALTMHDWTMLHRMAHSLKSSSATFGAMRLSQVAAHLEQLAKGSCANGDCASVLSALIVEHGMACAALSDERARFATM